MLQSTLGKEANRCGGVRCGEGCKAGRRGRTEARAAARQSCRLKLNEWDADNAEHRQTPRPEAASPGPVSPHSCG